MAELAAGYAALAARCAVLAARCAEAVRVGHRLYRAENPVRVRLTTAVPRLLLQCAFLTLLGRLLAGPSGGQYAYVGSSAFAVCSVTIVMICDVPMEDTFCGTYYRLQLGCLRPALVYLCRSVPYTVDGMAGSVLVLLVGGPALGFATESGRLVPLLPLYALICLTSTMTGLAVAAIAVGRSADVLLGNLTSYLILAMTGVVRPVPRSLGWLAAAGRLLPVGHGLAAIRAALAGRPWQPQAALEAAVGASWLVVAIAVLQWRDHKLRTG